MHAGLHAKLLLFLSDVKQTSDAQHYFAVIKNPSNITHNCFMRAGRTSDFSTRSVWIRKRMKSLTQQPESSCSVE